jgi:hypothetical protein
MNNITLSPATQATIINAINYGPGINNQNYAAAYSAIYSDLKAYGGFNSGTLNWFSQAGLR